MPCLYCFISHSWLSLSVILQELRVQDSPTTRCVITALKKEESIWRLHKGRQNPKWMRMQHGVAQQAGPPELRLPTSASPQPMMRQAWFLHRRHTGHEVYTHRHMQTHRQMHTNIWASCGLCSPAGNSDTKTDPRANRSSLWFTDISKGGAGALHLDTLFRGCTWRKGVACLW